MQTKSLTDRFHDALVSFFVLCGLSALATCGISPDCMRGGSR